jgi:hypothetical protein
MAFVRVLKKVFFVIIIIIINIFSFLLDHFSFERTTR